MQTVSQESGWRRSLFSSEDAFGETNQGGNGEDNIDMEDGT